MQAGAASAKSNSAPNQSNSSEIHLRSERQTKPISAKWFGMAGKITLRKLQRKLKQRSLSPRLSGGARSTSNRQTVYFQSITLPCTNTCENRHTNTCANTNMICKYKYKFEIWLLSSGRNSFSNNSLGIHIQSDSLLSSFSTSHILLLYFFPHFEMIIAPSLESSTIKVRK